MMKRLLICLNLVLWASLAMAIWMQPGEMPVERLQENLEKLVAENPNDAKAHYLLGRLHSYQFAFKKQTVPFYGERGQLDFPSFDDLKYEPGDDSKERVDHLVTSLEHYRVAVGLDGSDKLARIGFVWMHEQAATVAGVLPDIKGVSKRGQTKQWWLEKALAQYRALYRSMKSKELAGEGGGMGIENQFASYEAAERISHLIEVEKIGAYQAGEKADLEATKKALDAKPKWVTPIVVPVGADVPSLMVDSNSQVSFDLLGNGLSGKRGWITSQAAFLVWDPKGQGKITSGQQLFGTGTFWMFFGNGFAAMSYLDDNRDGWLSGRELAGLSLWQDADGDGVSNLREVRPVSEWGIMALRCGGERESAIGYSVDRGVVWNDGRVTGLYDWVTK